MSEIKIPHEHHLNMVNLLRNLSDQTPKYGKNNNIIPVAIDVDTPIQASFTPFSDITKGK